MRAAARASITPAASGASGPTTTKSTRSSIAVRTIASTSAASMSGKHGTSLRAMPALPGAAITSGCWGLRSNARTRACSRPPPPTTRTLVTSESGDEVVDRDRRERLVARSAARPELHRHPRHRLLVGSLDDVHEVEAAERRPLRLDTRSERFDLLVDLTNARRVVLHRLYALRRERREHD